MKKTLWIGLLCVLPSFAGAGVTDFAKTKQEEAMCQTMIYSGRDTSDRANWQHMHHYCDCVRFTNRAYSALGNWRDMKYYLQIGIGGCDYVLAHTTPGFHMRSEVHLQKGKALRLYRQEGRAIAEFMEAIKGNPALAQAYVELADIQARIKKTGEALKTVTEGLRHAPESKPLRRRYTELGGKLPYPDPVAPPQVDAQAVKPAETVPPAPAIPAEPTVGATATVTPAAETITPPQIGSPKNPYCRFCPD